MKLIGWIIVLFALGSINSIIGIIGVRRFLIQEISIKTSQSLEVFKLMVRKQMYQALFQIGVLSIMGIMAVIGIITRKLSFKEFLLFLALNVVILILGKSAKGIEQKARSLTVEDKSLADEYRSVCKTWVKKPFPDFK